MTMNGPDRRGSADKGSGPVRRGSAFRRSGGGFTLLEILIAMSILAVAMLGIIKMQMMSGRAIGNSRNLSAATNLCRGKIEDLRRIRAYYRIKNTEPVQTHDDLIDPEAGASADLADWASPDHEDGGTMTENAGAGGGFTRSWNVVDNSPAPQVKTVRVRVSWTETGTARQVELETQIGLKTLEYYN